MTFAQLLYMTAQTVIFVNLFECSFVWYSEEKSILLSHLVAENPSVSDFWALERCVSALARKYPETQQVMLQFDVEPEFRCTPRKWQAILIAAHERGLRARPGGAEY